MSTWVRARDGALYHGPVLVHPRDHGFVHFTDIGCEVVVWLSETSGCVGPKLVLHDLLGDDGWHLLQFHETALRAPPGAEDPNASHLAVCWLFSLRRRIPRPTYSSGQARFATRLRGQRIVDLPATPHDAYDVSVKS